MRTVLTSTASSVAVPIPRNVTTLGAGGGGGMAQATSSLPIHIEPSIAAQPNVPGTRSNRWMNSRCRRETGTKTTATKSGANSNATTSHLGFIVTQVSPKTNSVTRPKLLKKTRSRAAPDVGLRCLLITMFPSPRFAIAAVILFGSLVSNCAVWAQPQTGDFAPVVTGHLTRLIRGQTRESVPVTGATIEVFVKNNSVFKTTTDDEGAFRLDALPNPAGSYRQFVVLARPGRDDDDLDPAAAIVATPPQQGRAASLEMAMQPALKRTVRIVTLKDKKPVAGATLSVLNFRALASDGRSYGDVKIASTAIRPMESDARGEVTFAGIPTGALADVRVRRDEYADTIASVGRDQATVTVPLALETRVFGVYTLDGREPLDVPQWMAKMQGWKQPWADYNQWRTGNLNARGEYVIENVAPPAIIGEPTYGINLDLKNNFDPRAGVHADYVPFSGGWDVMVTIERNGQKRRYISYVEALENGLKFDEGSDLRHDFSLVPMALVKGKTRPGAPISYPNLRSIYGAWQQEADQNGDFEIPVPIGDVTLRVDNKAVELRALKAHETRVIALTKP